MRHGVIDSELPSLQTLSRREEFIELLRGNCDVLRNSSRSLYPDQCTNLLKFATDLVVPLDALANVTDRAVAAVKSMPQRHQQDLSLGSWRQLQTPVTAKFALLISFALAMTMAWRFRSSMI